MNKLKLIILAVAVALCPTVHATLTAVVDLGPSRIVLPLEFFSPQLPPFGLNGTAFNGQTISFDLTFSDSQFVRTFSPTTELDFILNLPTNQFGGNGGFSDGGTGFFFDAQGNSIGNPVTLSGFFEGGPATPFNNVGFIASLTGINGPLDFYGFHYNITLDSPGLVIDESHAIHSTENLQIFTEGGTHPLLSTAFGVGPGNIPPDFVPEGGNTVGLLLVGLGALALLKTMSVNQKPNRKRGC